MNKRFSFRMKVDGVYGIHSFYAPVENGFVITNYYCPKALLVGEGTMLSQVAVPQNGETEAEFIQDCNSIVAEANACTESDDTFYCLGQAANAIMIAHINRCGRLLFQDLLVYMDCLAYLLKAAGYADSEIKRVYPVIVKQIVDAARQYVRDSHTLLPFHVTNFYQILCRLAAQ